MDALGINIVYITAFTLIFLLVFFFARKFVVKVLATVEARQRIIEEGIKNAEEAETLKSKAIAEAEAEKKKVLQNAFKSAQEIVESAKAKEAVIVSDAQVRFEQILKEAQKDLDAIKNKSKHEGLSEAKDIITLAVKKAFEGLNIDNKTEEKLIEESLSKLS